MTIDGKNKFIILTHGRAGSTYLQQLLDSHPSISCYGEIFNVSNTDETSFYSFCQKQHPTLSFFFLRGKLSKTPLNFPLKFLFEQFRQRLYQRSDKETTGFKLIYNQLLFYKPLIEWVKDQSIPIIHLQRENVLKASISLLKARKTGEYTTSSSGAVGSKITIDPKQLLDELDVTLNEKTKCESIIRKNPTLHVYYEDLFQNPEDSIKKVISFLGVKQATLKMPDIVKTNPEKISDRVENYEEVRQSLLGSRWEKYLD